MSSRFKTNKASTPMENQPGTKPKVAKKKITFRVMNKNTKKTSKVQTSGKTKQPLSQSEQKKKNRALYQALKNNRPKNIKILVQEGASFAYLNWEGLELAAEKGHLKVYKTLFDQELVKNFIVRPIIKASIDCADEFGHQKLVQYLKSKLQEVPVEIKDLNMNGHEDGDDNYF
jgi:hypothetical protein